MNQIQNINSISWRSPPFKLKMYVKCTRVNSVAKMPKDSEKILNVTVK